MTVPSLAIAPVDPVADTPAAPQAGIRPPAVSLVILAGLAVLSSAATDTVIPLLSAMARDFPGLGAHVALAVSLFPVGSAIAQCVVGPLSDRLGRRRLLLGGCGLYALGNAGCALATSFAVLAAGRLLVGAGAGVCLTIAMAVVRDTTSGARSSATVANLTAAMWGASIVTVPLATWLLHAAGWRPIFDLMAFGGVVLLFAVAGRLPETLRPSAMQGPALRRLGAEYGPTLKSRVFRGHALIGAMAFSALFILAVGATTLLAPAGNDLGLYYGIVVAGLAAGSLCGTVALRRGATCVAVEGVALAAILLASAALFAMAVGRPADRFGAVPAAAWMTIATLAIGALAPCSIAGGMAPFRERAGTAAALLGISRMTASAGVSALVVLLGAADPTIVTAALVVCTVVATIAWLRLGADGPTRPLASTSFRPVQSDSGMRQYPLPGRSRFMDTLNALIRRVGTEGQVARDQLFAAAYDELRKLARSRLHDGGRSTCLETTALVHESYLRILKAGELRIEDRRAFFGYASRVMRSVIIDAVRERKALRHGGDLVEVVLDTQSADALPGNESEVLRVHETLLALEAVEPRLAKVVEMRYFGGYSDAEIADALSITDRTVRRDWEKARLMLMSSLQG